mmetsp:Transcript_4226/g.13149  ORF Transcript_4226/g.13149 Transcript_4226/m.13149 type:complete len:264 (+) Transcript_4226:209-1000(+)
MFLAAAAGAVVLRGPLAQLVGLGGREGDVVRCRRRVVRRIDHRRRRSGGGVPSVQRRILSSAASEVEAGGLEEAVCLREDAAADCGGGQLQTDVVVRVESTDAPLEALAELVEQVHVVEQPAPALLQVLVQPLRLRQPRPQFFFFFFFPGRRRRRPSSLVVGRPSSSSLRDEEGLVPGALHEARAGLEVAHRQGQDRRGLVDAVAHALQARGSVVVAGVAIAVDAPTSFGRVRSEPGVGVEYGVVGDLRGEVVVPVEAVLLRT